MVFHQMMMADLEEAGWRKIQPKKVSFIKTKKYQLSKKGVIYQNKKSINYQKKVSIIKTKKGINYH